MIISFGYLPKKAAPPAAVETKKGKRANGKTRAAVQSLINSGITSPSLIASKLGIGVAAVGYHIKILEGALKPLRPELVDDPADLDAEMQKLRKRLDELQHKQETLAKAKMLRVELVGEKGFSISKEGEHMILPLVDVEQLIEMLFKITPVKEVA